MPRYIARVIELEDRNSYREGLTRAGDDDIRLYLREARIKAYRSRQAGIRPGSSDSRFDSLNDLEEVSKNDTDDNER